MSRFASKNHNHKSLKFYFHLLKTVTCKCPSPQNSQMCSISANPFPHSLTHSINVTSDCHVIAIIKHQPVSTVLCASGSLALSSLLNPYPLLPLPSDNPPALTSHPSPSTFPLQKIYKKRSHSRSTGLVPKDIPFGPDRQIGQ